MTEATWGSEAMTPDIDWHMSASLAKVHRGDIDVSGGWFPLRASA